MIRKLLLLSLCLVAILGIGLAALAGVDALIRTPHRLARQVSSLEVPGRARVLSFRDEASGFLGQDLWVEVELALSPADFSRLRAEAIQEGWQAVVHSDPPDLAVSRDSANQFGVSTTGASDAAAELPLGTSGLFRYERDTQSSYSLAVLDPARQRLLVRVLIL